MKDYSGFEALDFAQDEAFVNWVRNPDAAQDRFWTEWLASHPDKREEVREARRMIEAFLYEKQHAPSQPEKRALWDRIEEKLDDTEENLSTRSPWYLRAAAAISVIVVAGIAVFWHLRQGPDVIQPGSFAEEKMIEKKNNGSAPLAVRLKDGSSIVLEPQSSIRYPADFTDDRREVYLSGSGFFDIAKDAQRPFLVYANELVTRVLGTSFTIRAYDREPEVVVEVRTGKVSVFTQQEMNAGKREKKNTRLEGVVLTPNQKVVYSREDSKLVKSLVENPSLLPSSAQTESFEFNDTPMREVFAVLEEAYGVEIVFDEEVMANCYLNALLTHESLEEKLTLVCKAVNAHYEVMDTHIIIYGKGCGKHR